MTRECSIQLTDQILNFGGPWVGNLKIGDLLIEGKYLHQDVICDELNDVVYVAKFIDHGYFRWQVHFRLVAIKLNSYDMFISKKRFSALCIESAEKNIVTFYRNFCEGTRTQPLSLELNDKNFKALK